MAEAAREFGGVEELIDWQGRGASSGHRPKPRLLALHGWRSNSRVTERQVANLGLDRTFDVTFLDGFLESETAADEVVDSLFDGPFFSWVDQADWERGTAAHNALDQQQHAPVLMDSLRFLVSEVSSLPLTACICCCCHEVGGGEHHLGIL